MKSHNSFQLNGKTFSSSEEIIQYSKEISEEVHFFLKEWFSEDLSIEVNTSGSTGIPKTIFLKKEFLINSALTTGNTLDLKANTTALMCLSANYIAGKMMLVRALVLGWHLDIVPTDVHPLKDVQTTYAFCAMVPLQLEHSLAKIHLIKKIIVGGGVVSSYLQEKLQVIESSVFATYGMTETISHIAFKKLNNFSKGTSDTLEKSYYTVLSNVKIYKDTRNCLVIHAPKVSEEIIFTNDVVELISDTQFSWVGRFDNVINSGGIKLHPEIIEEKLSEIISNRFFVAGIPDERLGEKLILILEGNPQQLHFNKAHLSKYEIPKETYFVDVFIETETKKIQRKKTLDLIDFIK